MSAVARISDVGDYLPVGGVIDPARAGRPGSCRLR